MQITESKIPFNYKTIKVTQSRIDKGLLAIPVSLIDYFPKNKMKVYVSFGGEKSAKPKNYTPYTSTSRECRIGGMREFYDNFNIKDGDELVIQLIDDNRYRIQTESQFKDSIIRAEKTFDEAKDEIEAELMLKQISEVTASSIKRTLLSEFFRLSNKEIELRRYNKPRTVKVKSKVPPSIRTMLTKLYNGKCQISGFSFLMKNGKPYFEIHHIKPTLGNHLKNLLVVCPNIHAQFTYAVVEEYFDKQGWLRKVRFNEDEYLVKHVTDFLPEKFQKEIHFM